MPTKKTTPEAKLQETDLPLIRVIEDLVDVLIEKGVLNLTDLPPSAIKKLSLRSKLRQDRQTLRGLVSESDDIPL